MMRSISLVISRYVLNKGNVRKTPVRNHKQAHAVFERKE